MIGSLRLYAAPNPFTERIQLTPLLTTHAGNASSTVFPILPIRTRWIRIIETHISCVALAGPYAYKIKKPVALGFLDFTELSERKRLCAEELRLNRRFAPDLYLDIVAFHDSGGHIRIDDAGPSPIVEYAVRMQRFDPRDALDRRLDSGRASAEMIDQLADGVASFHRAAQVATESDPWGQPATILAAALDNFTSIQDHIPHPEDRAAIDRLQDWTRATYAKHVDTFLQRRREGFVRECHGDLHPGNVIVSGEQVIPFDCIEFSPGLRWIDVMNEIAFPVMDLYVHQHAAWSWRFLNTYLGHMGDYDGLAILPFYLVYRAIVRAKVHSLQASNVPAISARAEAHWQSVSAHLEAALHYAAAPAPFLILMHGLSGSGKSTVASHLVERFGAIAIRSDVERKRDFGYAELATTTSGMDSGIYSAEANRLTYAHLLHRTQAMIAAGFAVIVDAAFLRHADRENFLAASHRLGVPAAIVTCAAPHDLLRARIRERIARATDASEASVAVLDRQIGEYEPLQDAHLAASVLYRAADDSETGSMQLATAQLAQRIGKQGLV
jgi:aminoglycoside phosphotransferase family enzyme/predicted kinase